MSPEQHDRVLESNAKSLLSITHKAAGRGGQKRARGGAERTTQDYEEKNAHQGEACRDFKSLFAPLGQTPYPFSNADRRLRAAAYEIYRNARVPLWLKTSVSSGLVLATDSRPLLTILGRQACVTDHFMPRGYFVRIRSDVLFDAIAGDTHKASFFFKQEATYPRLQFIPWSDDFEPLLEALQQTIII